MKRTFLFKKIVILFLLVSTCAFAQRGTNPFSPGAKGQGFIIAVVDSPVTSVVGLLNNGVATKNNYQAMRTNGKVYATTTAAETCNVYIAGIDSATGRFFTEQLRVKTGLNDTTTKTLIALQGAWLDTEATAMVDVRNVTGAALSLTSVTAGNIHNSPAQALFGNNDRPAITSIHAAAAGGTTGWRAELRVYATLADARDNTDGYWVVWQGVALPYTSVSHVFPEPIYLHPNNIVQLWGASMGSDMKLSATITGYRKGD